MIRGLKPRVIVYKELVAQVFSPPAHIKLGRKRKGEALDAFVHPDLEQRYRSLTGKEIHLSVLSVVPISQLQSSICRESQSYHSYHQNC